MKKLLLVLVAIGLIFAMFWFLPWWVSLAVLLIVVLPLAWLVWKFISMLRKIVKVFVDAIPKEKLCSLAAGEPFQGHGFSFTLPVPCVVSHTVLDDLEALILKPQVQSPGEPGDALLVVSTIAKEEMKAKVTEKLRGVLSKVQGLQQSEFRPLEVGSLHGEYRTFEASKEGKSISGESVYLGDSGHSVAWLIMASRPSFDVLASKYRELACLIGRVSEPASKA